MKQTIILTLEDQRLNVEVTGESVSALDIMTMCLNGIVAVADEIVEQTKQNEDFDEELIRENLYNHMVTSFSAAMLSFNPAAKDYKKMEE